MCLRGPQTSLEENDEVTCDLKYASREVSRSGEDIQRSNNSEPSSRRRKTELEHPMPDYKESNDFFGERSS